MAEALNAESINDLKIVKEDTLCKDSIYISLLDRSAALQELLLLGNINLHNKPAELDAFEVLIYNQVLIITGNTPRGLLNAVYELKELLLENVELQDSLHIKKAFRFPIIMFHQTFMGWPGEHADVRYISHMGASHCLVDHDWNTVRNFQCYVTSPIFPHAVNPEIQQKTS